MFSRTITRSCARVRPALGRSRKSPGVCHPAKRRYSSSSGAATMNSSTTTHGVLAPFTSELDKIAPSFQINGSQIEILKTPADFYETLKVWFLTRSLSILIVERQLIMIDLDQNTSRQEKDILVYFVHRQIRTRTSKTVYTAATYVHNAHQLYRLTRYTLPCGTIRSCRLAS